MPVAAPGQLNQNGGAQAMIGNSSLRVGRCESGFLVCVIGRGTMKQSAAFREFVMQCFEQHHGGVVVDVGDCDYLDSTFLGCLIGLQKECEHDPSRFVIAADKDARMRLFITSTLDRYLKFVEAAPPTTSDVLTLATPDLTSHELGLHVLQSHRQLASLECKDADQFKSIADRLSRELDR